MKSGSKVITGGVFAGIIFLSLGIPTEGEVGEVLRGRAVFVKNCVVCHGINAMGNGPLAETLPQTPANLTDCRLTAEDSIEVLQETIRHGGPYIGLSDAMPAWGGTLTEQEIADVVRYVKSLCTDSDWVPGDVNFPRPLITGKAMPEQEAIIGGRFGQGSSDETITFLNMGYRLDGRTNIELSTSVLSVRPQIGSTESGLGDSAISIKRVVAFSLKHQAIASVGLRLQLPTGSDRRGLGAGEVIWQPNLRVGWQWKEIVTQVATRLSLPHDSANQNARVQYNLAVGHLFEPDPRLQITPMIEITNETRINGPQSGDTFSAILPEIRIQWLQWSAAFGVQVPVTGVRPFNLRPLFDLTYEYQF